MDFDVVIVEGGPAGPTAANGLKQLANSPNQSIRGARSRGLSGRP